MSLRDDSFALALVLALFAAAAGAPAQTPGTKAEAARPADSSAAALRPDSALARADSGMILKKELSAEDYLSRREQFFYPHTRREDPFNFPMDKGSAGEVLGPILSELKLSGVIYTMDGPRIAILDTPTGGSFLLREGDRLGLAEVVLIEPASIRFRISEFGQVHEILIELKPLVEEKDGQSPEKAGSGGRPEETQEKVDESGGPPPQRR